MGNPDRRLKPTRGQKPNSDRPGKIPRAKIPRGFETHKAPKNSQVKIAKRGRVDTDPIMAWGPGIKMVVMRPKAKAET